MFCNVTLIWLSMGLFSPIVPGTQRVLIIRKRVLEFRDIFWNCCINDFFTSVHSFILSDSFCTFRVSSSTLFFKFSIYLFVFFWCCHFKFLRAVFSSWSKHKTLFFSDSNIFFDFSEDINDNWDEGSFSLHRFCSLHIVFLSLLLYLSSKLEVFLIRSDN